MSAEETVEGRIVFGEDASPFEGASVTLILEDTTYADAPAKPLHSLELRQVAYNGKPDGSIPFCLRGNPAAPGRRYSLRVSIDIDGDGRLGVGDYRNAESVEVVAGTEKNLLVRMKRLF